MTETTKQQVLFPTYARTPVAFVKGEGSRLWDEQGKAYLDFVSGLAVTNLGHCHPAVKAALHEQVDQLWHVSNLYQVPQQEKLAQKLIEISDADRVFFCNSGAEANEAAIKLARKYHQNVLQTGRNEIVTFEQSFHGRTLATLTATGQDKVKDGFHPLPAGFVYSPYNDLDALASKISDRTCAIMLEMVQGEGGVNPAEPSFVQGVAELCREHGILMIVDEIQTGIGRTGKWFAYQHYGIEPDIVTVAKGLGNGFPIGAMLGKAHLAEAFGPGSHATTFGGTPIASSVGLAVLETMDQQQLIDRVADLGSRLLSRLQERYGGRKDVLEIRGKGLLIGIQFDHAVADYIQQAREKGLLVVQAGPNVLRLLPNFLVTETELDEAMTILEQVLGTEK
ncbi:acetylornithine transaminase [Marinicrinis sediminis]|uniref:Acetylornithine aminotransferase n=1 Tax=Marinicrinis sediminis TaxID=1652465 RepID=A0ABW5RAF0_9BACL